MTLIPNLGNALMKWRFQSLSSSPEIRRYEAIEIFLSSAIKNELGNRFFKIILNTPHIMPKPNFHTIPYLKFTKYESLSHSLLVLLHKLKPWGPQTEVEVYSSQSSPYFLFMTCLHKWSSSLPYHHNYFPPIAWLNVLNFLTCSPPDLMKEHTYCSPPNVI